MITFTDTIRQEVDLSMKRIGSDLINDVTKVREAIDVMEKVFNSLRVFIREYEFQDNQEEVLFFKNIKPFFSCQSFKCLNLAFILFGIFGFSFSK